MRLETYISDLLYRYQCVVVPNFGAFLTRVQPARLNADTSMWYPPAKLVSFNVQLSSNDGLLAKYIADTKKISYEEALQYIAKKVDGWTTSFQHKETVSLKNLGDLWLNEVGSIQFQPLEHVNYLSAAFGLAPVFSNIIIRETLKHEVMVLEETAPLHFTPGSRKNRTYLRYAAVFLLMISIGTVGYRMIKNNRSRQYEMVQQEAQKEIEKTIQQATFFDTNPATLPSITLTLRKHNKEALKYHVVGGAFRIESNADKKISELIAKGYKARKAGINRYGLHIVSYGSFAGADEALSFLKTVRQTEIRAAWLWVSQ